MWPSSAVSSIATRPVDRKSRFSPLQNRQLRSRSVPSSAVPLVVHNFSSPSADSPRDEPHEAEAVRPDSERFASLANAPVAGRSPTVVLEDFTSDPPPLVTARQPHEFLVQSIDERPAHAGRAVDLITNQRIVETTVIVDDGEVRVLL